MSPAELLGAVDWSDLDVDDEPWTVNERRREVFAALEALVLQGDVELTHDGDGLASVPVFAIARKAA